MQMSLDSTTTGDTNIGWPGDIPTKTWAGWAGLVTNGYLGTNDFLKILGAPGIVPAGDPAALVVGAKSGRAVILYPITETNDASYTLFTSANFSNAATPTVPGASNLPYGIKGFVVFRKGGDGSVLQNRQYSNTAIIGPAPGAGL